MNSRRISLALATVVTILSGTTLPSHADRSCPLGFTSAGSVGCQKVVKVTIENICLKGRRDILPGRDQCRTRDNNSFLGGENITSSEADPKAKQEALEKLIREPDSGFTNPGAPIRQRRVVATSEKILIDYDKRRDFSEITFDVIILPNSPS
jgi:hypothetical protein